ncbi:hypothetical protein, partial [Escherichia coli]|uniref:hypothetical protein n=1 Tax=Escherichia coli TaxID=562 RepID=UPI0018E26492
MKFYMGMPVTTSIAIPAIELSNINSSLKQLAADDSLNIENRTEFKIIKKQEDLLSLQKKAYEAEYY